ncbi:unnamed protein product [Camellia sinensis]
MAKSWLDVQVDLELARLQPGGMDQFKTYEDAIDRSHGQGDGVSPSTVRPENWPLQVLNQQPRHLSALLQKLHSRMNLMMGDITHLLDIIWTWISPSEDEENVFRPHGDPQMIFFGAHLVLVLTYLLVEQMNDAFREKIMTVGDLILHIMTEYKGEYSDIVTVPRFSQLNYCAYDSKGSFEAIVDRVLSRSREIKPGKYDKSSDVAEQHRLQSLQKAMVVQWLCFTPTSTINDAQASSAKLLLRALLHRH